jgi:hypothetical protein
MNQHNVSELEKHYLKKPNVTLDEIIVEYRKLFSLTTRYRDAFLNAEISPFMTAYEKIELTEDLKEAWKSAYFETAQKIGIENIKFASCTYMLKCREGDDYLTTKLLKELSENQEKLTDIMQDKKTIMYFEAKYALNFVEMGAEKAIPVLRIGVDQGYADQEDAHLAMYECRKKNHATHKE